MMKNTTTVCLKHVTMQSQTKVTTYRKVTRTNKGNASGVTVATSNPLYQFISHHLVDNCCDLAAFKVDEVYCFQLSLLEMTKEEKVCCCWGKSKQW